MLVYSDDSRTKKIRREHIVEVAKKLCFERSIGNTTMNDIAKESGMGRSTMYEYFKSKLELMELIRRLYLNEIYDFSVEIDSKKTGFEQLENMLIIYANKLFEHPNELVFLMEFNRFVSVTGVEKKVSELSMYPARSYLSHIIDQGVKDGSLDVSNLEKRISILFETIFGAATRFATKEKYSYDETEIAVHRNDMKDLIPILLYGIRTEHCKML